MSKTTETHGIGFDLRVQAALLVDHNGTPEEQKEELVSAILAIFTDPAKWPMTDEARCDLLRQWYRRAQTIQQTEAVMKRAEASK